MTWIAKTHGCNGRAVGPSKGFVAAGRPLLTVPPPKNVRARFHFGFPPVETARGASQLLVEREQVLDARDAPGQVRRHQVRVIEIRQRGSGVFGAGIGTACASGSSLDRSEQVSRKMTSYGAPLLLE